MVAEALGFEHDEALTLGGAVAGLNANPKRASLGPKIELLGEKILLAGLLGIELRRASFPHRAPTFLQPSKMQTADRRSHSLQPLPKT